MSYRDIAPLIVRGESIMRKVNVTTGAAVTGHDLAPEEGAFLLRYHGKTELVVCGAGHVSEQLCKVATIAGFAVTVIDHRAELATKERFPDAANIICAPFEEGIAKEYPRDAFFAVMTSGHIHDKDCLAHILKKPFAYCGCIGSKAKAAIVRETLIAEGFDKELVESIHSPIGLKLGGGTPGEIAVDICAQLIQERSKLPRTIEARDIFKAISKSDEPMIMVTIIERSGSTPRDTGAQMLVTGEGITGTIGGGQIEYQAIAAARELIKAPRFTVKDCYLAGGEMVCGGYNKLMFEPV